VGLFNHTYFIEQRRRGYKEVSMSTISYPVCPNCASRLRGGWPSFGPRQAVCGYCGTLINTKLDGWNEGPFPSPMRKIRLVLTELFIPTCMGYTEPELRFLLNLLWLMPTLFLPIFPAVRLVKMIAESLQHDKTKSPPQWKWIFHQVKK
jgi:hypothetical protein